MSWVCKMGSIDFLGVLVAGMRFPVAVDLRGLRATGKMLSSGTRSRSEAGMIDMNHDTLLWTSGPGPEPEPEPGPVTAWNQKKLWVNHIQISVYGVLDELWMCTP